ncbi:MAG TPA: endospore germination permease [Clostridiales bacterium]|nr:endospore germination permease [Clostridiales bacterium]
MQKETISSHLAVCILILFIFGSSVILGVNCDAEQDSWISLILALLLTLPFLLIYARIMKLFPEKDIFEIIETVFGKIFGKCFILLLSWYGLHLCALVLRDFSEFVEISFMPETPQVPIMIIMIVVVAYMVVSGVKTMGRWSLGVLPFILFVVVLTTTLAIHKMDFTNIQPVLEHHFRTIFVGSYKLFTFPLAETVLFLVIADAVRKEDSPYRIYLYAIFFGVLVLLIVILRNMLLLGSEVVCAEYFPSYMAARILSVADFMARIEGSIAMNFILAGVVKMAVCLIAATKGLAYLFHLANYKQIVFPMALLSMALCVTLYSNAMEMFDFLDIYQYYAIPFQIIIPLLIWLFAEIKIRRQKVPEAQ